MRPELLQRQGPVDAPGSGLVFATAEVRDRCLNGLIAAAGPAVPVPLDARHVGGQFTVDLAPLPSSRWPPEWPDSAVARAAEMLCLAAARLHDQGLEPVGEIAVGEPDGAVPASWCAVAPLEDPKRAWRAVAVALGAVCPPSLREPLERGAAPLPHEPPAQVKIPRAMAAWYAAALAGRQGGQSVDDAAVAGIFALRCAARGALVLAVDGGGGLVRALRLAIARRLRPDQASRLGFAPDLERLLQALPEVCDGPVLVVVSGELDREDQAALRDAPRASGLAPLQVIGHPQPIPALTAFPVAPMAPMGNQDDAIAAAWAAGDMDAVAALLDAPGVGARRAWAAHVLGRPATALVAEIDRQLAHGEPLGAAESAGLGALRIRLALADDQMDLAFAFADRVLQSASADDGGEHWRALVSARVDHEVGTPLATAGAELLELLGADREASPQVDHVILLAEALTLLAQAGEGALAQRAIDGAAAWALALPPGYRDWLADRVVALGIRWPEPTTGGDPRLWQCVTALAGASTVADVAEAVRAALSALTGRLVGLTDSDGLRISALPELRFSEVSEADLPALAPLDDVIAATARRVRRAQARVQHVARLYATVLSGLDLTATLPALVQFAVEESGAARGQLVVVDDARAVVYSAGSVHGYSGTLLDVVDRQQHSIILPDAMEDPRLAGSASAFHLGLRGVLLCPLRRDGAEGQLLGALLLEGTGFKPDATQLIDTLAPYVTRLVDAVRQRRQPDAPLAQLPDAMNRLGFVAAAPAMLEVVTKIEQVAHLDVPILILGETGTGKEVVAGALHQQSPRANGPFQAINCGALPENILEGELFGYRKGAFTGATRDNPGLLRAAHRGVLFLDEIGEMSLEMQKRLLRVLQEREVQPLGGGASVSIDVRIVAATHQGLRQAVATGRFREDLYYRLRVIEIRLPPLRERIEDVPALSRVLLDRAARKIGGPPARLERRALKALMAHAWPGNVRELEHTLMRATALCRDGVIAVADLELDDADSRRAPGSPPPTGTVDRGVALLEFAAAREAFVCRDWADAAGISSATALRDLNALVDQGTLRRIGVRRAARYLLSGASDAERADP